MEERSHCRPQDHSPPQVCQDWFAERQGAMLRSFSEELRRAKEELRDTVHHELEQHWRHYDEMFARVQPALVENAQLREENARLRIEIEEHDRPSQVSIVLPAQSHHSSLRPTSASGWFKLIAVGVGAAVAGFISSYLK